MAGRTWLAVALCMMVWFGYLKWFAPPPPAPGTTQTQTQTQGGDNKSAQTPTAPAGAIAAFAKPIPVAPSQQPTLSGKLEVAFSDVGGKVAAAAVTTYRETTQPDSKFIAPIDAQNSPHSLATLFSDPALEELGRATYDRKDESGQVTYSKTLGDVTVTKVYKLNDGDYTIDATYTIAVSSGAQRRDLGFVMLPVGAKAVVEDKADPLKTWEVCAYVNESVTRQDVTAIEKDKETVLQGNTGWLAFGNRYFSTILINNTTEMNPDVVFAQSSDFTGGYLRFPLRLKEGQNSVTLKTKIFVGPNSYTELSKYPGLRRLINFGMFSFIAYPLLELLKFFYKFIHNYGLAIILLTVLVRLIFYPLQAKATKSMKEMQKLQPQILLLKERYKNDPAKMNQETMALYKAHKVNPAGGCLPMLVQLPVFFALYAVLGYSVELFHAPFFGWIHDLTAKDPYYVFPILMGIAMFIQQKMTPTPGMDPAQAKMMLMMPIVMTFVMLSLPAGLTLYIFISTILGIAQQLIQNREKSTTVPAWQS